MIKKTIVITGVTGQDGSLLAEAYLNKDFRVYGLVRRKADGSLGNAKHLEKCPDLYFIESDINDASAINELCQSVKPNYFINCAAQSHVGLSFSLPSYTVQTTGIGVLNCLEAIRMSSHNTRFLQLSSSEMFGKSDGKEKLSEKSPMYPSSPYASAKMLGYNLVKNYRDSYGLFAANSIAFNHECPGRRGPDFVTRKIAMAVAKISKGLQSRLSLGNLDSYRDWGHAQDYIGGMIKILEHKEPDDFVLATGESYSVRDFCSFAFSHVGIDDWQSYIDEDPNLLRPNDVLILQGDPSKAFETLGWKATTSFEDLVREMVEFELDALRHINQDKLVQTATNGLAVLSRA